MLERISFNFSMQDAEACIECKRLPAHKMAYRLANGCTTDEFVNIYPWYKKDDITALLDYAEFLSKERLELFNLNNQNRLK